jgi:hypothetical protein
VTSRTKFLRQHLDQDGHHRSVPFFKPLCTDFKYFAGAWTAWRLLAMLGIHLSAGAMSWFLPDHSLREYPLSSAETAQLVRQAGWPAEDPTTWMITVRNPLPGPITCREVQFFLKGKDAPTSVRTLPTPFYIPAGQSRSTLLPDVRKSDIKDWAMPCQCLRTRREGPCEKLP